jgi:hypothetical protein
VLGDELLAPPLGVLDSGAGLVELELLELGELELAPPEAEPDLVSLDADPLMLPEGELEEDGLDGLEGLEELDDEAPPDGDVERAARRRRCAGARGARRSLTTVAAIARGETKGKRDCNCNRRKASCVLHGLGCKEAANCAPGLNP